MAQKVQVDVFPQKLKHPLIHPVGNSLLNILCHNMHQSSSAQADLVTCTHHNYLSCKPSLQHCSCALMSNLMCAQVINEIILLPHKVGFNLSNSNSSCFIGQLHLMTFGDLSTSDLTILIGEWDFLGFFWCVFSFSSMTSLTAYSY